MYKTRMYIVHPRTGSADERADVEQRREGRVHLHVGAGRAAPAPPGAQAWLLIIDN